MERALVHGVRLPTGWRGRVRLVVLVHGMAGAGATWDLALPALAERYTVRWPLDLPGPWLLGEARRR